MLRPYRGHFKDFLPSEHSFISVGSKEMIHAISSEGDHPGRVWASGTKTGRLGATIQSILAALKPEAVCFTDDNGQRTAFLSSISTTLHRSPLLPSRGC
jgi:hypothetical protein